MNQTIVNCASFASLIILVTNATAGAQLKRCYGEPYRAKGNPRCHFQCYRHEKSATTKIRDIHN